MKNILEQEAHCLKGERWARIFSQGGDTVERWLLQNSAVHYRNHNFYGKVLNTIFGIFYLTPLFNYFFYLEFFFKRLKILSNVYYKCFTSSLLKYLAVLFWVGWNTKQYLHSTLPIVHYTLQRLHSTLFSIFGTLYITLYSMHSTLYSIIL